MRFMKNSTTNNTKKIAVAVVGAGAAGLMAAGTAALQGAEVLLFEHNEKVGRKLAITGKGRCNVTNNCDMQEFLAHVPQNPRFLYSALGAFSVQDTMDFFEQQGVPLKTERGNRVFPVSDNARDIVDALFYWVRKCGVTILREEVTDIYTNYLSQKPGNLRRLLSRICGWKPRSRPWQTILCPSK